MKEKYFFSESEYNSLREELVNRIGFIYSQSSTALTTIISTWAAGITLFIFLSGNSLKLPFIDEIIIRFINSFIFLIPVAFFIPLSIKSGENLTQIASLSAYIRVFFEYLSTSSNDNTIPLYNWEISNTLVSNINAFRKNKGKFILMFNEEFTILSIISVIMYLFNAGLNIKFLLETHSKKICLIYLCLIIYVICTIISIVIVIKIHSSSCAKKNLIDKSPIFIEAYINRAFKLKLITKDQIAKIFEQINPNNQIYRTNGTIITT